MTTHRRKHRGEGWLGGRPLVILFLLSSDPSLMRCEPTKVGSCPNVGGSPSKCWRISVQMLEELCPNVGGLLGLQMLESNRSWRAWCGYQLSGLALAMWHRFSLTRSFYNFAGPCRLGREVGGGVGGGVVGHSHTFLFTKKQKKK